MNKFQLEHFIIVWTVVAAFTAGFTLGQHYNELTSNKQVKELDNEESNRR